MQERQIQQILKSRTSSDGDGVRIQRTLGEHRHDLDPFLMLDEIRSDNSADYIGGFPPHPHRGIETLTYMLAGGFVHKDNLGHRAALSNGGAQWMSTGRGIIHSEMPLMNDGLLHGFQLWINLPAAQKMKPPEYRQAEGCDIPVLTLPTGGTARVFGGSWTLDNQTITSPIPTMSANARALDLHLPANGSLVLDLPPADTLLAYVYQGELASSPAVQRGQLVRFGTGERVTLVTSETDVRLLLFAGTPLGEPIAQHGPFVMNTEDEIRQAIADYRSGRFGQALQDSLFTGSATTSCCNDAAATKER